MKRIISIDLFKPRSRENMQKLKLDPLYRKGTCFVHRLLHHFVILSGKSQYKVGNHVYSRSAEPVGAFGEPLIRVFTFDEFKSLRMNGLQAHFNPHGLDTIYLTQKFNDFLRDAVTPCGYRDYHNVRMICRCKKNLP